MKYSAIAKTWKDRPFPTTESNAKRRLKSGRGNQWATYKTFLMPDYEGDSADEESIAWLRIRVSSLLGGYGPLLERMNYVNPYEIFTNPEEFGFTFEGAQYVDGEGNTVTLTNEQGWNLVFNYFLWQDRMLEMHETIMKINQFGTCGKGGCVREGAPFPPVDNSPKDEELAPDFGGFPLNTRRYNMDGQDGELWYSDVNRNGHYESDIDYIYAFYPD